MPPRFSRPAGLLPLSLKTGHNAPLPGRKALPSLDFIQSAKGKFAKPVPTLDFIQRKSSFFHPSQGNADFDWTKSNVGAFLVQIRLPRWIFSNVADCSRYPVHPNDEFLVKSPRIFRPQCTLKSRIPPSISSPFSQQSTSSNPASSHYYQLPAIRTEFPYP